jgi:hypothetical protein
MEFESKVTGFATGLLLLGSYICYLTYRIIPALW